MAIEIIRKNGKVIAYRSNVYYKEQRYIGRRRQTKEEAELDELEQKRDLLTCNHVEETNKTLNDGFDDYLTLVTPKRLSTHAFNSTKSY